MAHEAVIETRGIIRDFGAFRAVNDVSLSIRQGTVTGLIGPNGAGKTTLFNVLAGMLAPTAGKISLNGEDVTGASPQALFAKGLARTFQIPRPFKRMSVFENVVLAPPGQIGESLYGAIFNRKAVGQQEEALKEKALEILDFMTLLPLADQPSGKISGGQMKLLELARALMGDPSIILLDEPAAGVNPSLTRILIDRIEELNRQGTTFFIIEHDMDLVMRHCEPVIAMSEGSIIFEGSADEARENAELLDAYLGAPVA